MATTFQTIVTEVVNQAGFDASAADVGAWLDRRHKEMVRRSRILKGTTAVGNTVSGTAFYAVSNVLELQQLTVGGIPAGKATRDDAYSQTQGELLWSGEDGSSLFAVDGSAAGVSGIKLIPVPTTSGLAIVAFGTLLAPDLVLGNNVAVPDEFVDALVEGCMATGYARDQEQMGAADRCEARFDAKCEELRQIVRRSLRPGVSQIRVVGYTA